MRPIRIAFFAVAAAILITGIGCGKKDSAPTTKDSKPKDSPTLPTTPANTGESNGAALKAATDFVKAVQDGKATSASLSLAFKKIIAPAELDADKAVGFSESGAQAWLSAAKATAKAEGLKVDLATADYAILSSVGNKPGRVFLRLAKVGTSWLVDHARFNARSTIEVASAATLAAALFVEAVLAGDTPEIEALLSKTAKGKLAPPRFDDDKVQGFDRLNLRSSLADLFPAGLGFANVSQENAGLKATVTFTVAGANRIFVLTLAAGATPGEFLVDDLQQK